LRPYRLRERGRPDRLTGARYLFNTCLSPVRRMLGDEMLVSEYKDLSLATPDCHPESSVWRAEFRLDADVSHLFPYINAVVEGARLHESHCCILFALQKVNYSIYPDRVVAAPFADREQALERIQGLIDFLNDLENRRSSIEPRCDTCQPPVSVLEIFKLLPRTNCKECGLSTCMAFANALSKRELRLDLCPALHDAGSENLAKLRAMLG